MAGGPPWVVRVSYRCGRRRFYGPHGREICPERITKWQARGLLTPHDPGLLADEPQSYLYTGTPPRRWLAAVPRSLGG